MAQHRHCTFCTGKHYSLCWFLCIWPFIYSGLSFEIFRPAALYLHCAAYCITIIAWLKTLSLYITMSVVLVFCSFFLVYWEFTGSVWIWRAPSECWNTFLTAELYWQIEGLTGSWKTTSSMLPRQFIQSKLWMQTPGLQGKLCIGQWLWWKHALTTAGKCFCLSRWNASNLV